MRAPVSLRGSILDSIEAIDAHIGDWDRLAIASRRPTAAPAFGLGWLRHCAPPRTEPRIVVVRDADDVIGLAPYFAQHGRYGRTDYRLLGSGIFHRIGLLADPGAERAVAGAVGRALYEATPAPSLVTLEGVGHTPDWQSLLAETFPGPLSPRRYVSSVHGAPVVHLGARTFDEWLAGKSSNFRQQARSLRRRAGAQGATFRLATAETLANDLAAFARLHHLRWDGARGGTFLNDGIERALAAAATDLVPRERFRLWLVELDDTPIGAQVFAEAGGELVYWNGGYDPAFAKLRPGFLLMLRAIEDACTLGVERVDLGGGEHGYKLRFADGNDPIVWCGLMPRTRRYPVVRAQMLPSELSWRARRFAKKLLDRTPR